MIVRVRLFAAAKQYAGRDALELSVADGATVAEVRRALVASIPELASAAKHLLFAVGAEYAADGKVIRPDDDVACIPPVSGG